jgi:hypothetical protein
LAASRRVEYILKAGPDVKEKIFYGEGTFPYFNKFPDTLHSHIWHLYQNLFRKDSSRGKNNERNRRIFGSTQGITIESLSVDGISLVRHLDETIMETLLAHPLFPDSKTDMQWIYELPYNASLRPGV